jgi:hypothetical protein
MRRFIPADSLDPLQWLQKFPVEFLLGCQRKQPGGVGGFKVCRDPVRKLHGTIDLIILGSWHDFEM